MTTYIKPYLDKLGATSTLIIALAAAPSCCLPLLASVGTFLGLSVFAQYSNTLNYLFQFSALLTIVGAYLGFRQHHRWEPLAIVTISALGVLYAYSIALSENLVFLSLVGLIGGTIWNTIEGKKCSSCHINEIELESILTCPVCGHQKKETMPTDACMYFYECELCKTLLKPEKGDCCVFCSYGSVKCPPIQQGNTCAC